MFLSVRTYNFRNLKNVCTDTGFKNIYLIGENGQGKSNFLEMIYILCFGSSFRTRQDKLLITNGEKDMKIEGIFLDRNRLRNSISVKIESNSREIRQNDKIISDRKDLIENVPCIAYKHEDIYFVNGTPDKRRLFFNQTMGIYDIRFLESMRDYNKIIKMRNTVLKESNTDYISVLDQQLAEKGLELQRKRAAAVKEFSPVFSDVFKKVTGTDINIDLCYSPSWKGAETSEDVIKILNDTVRRDNEMGITTTGPHRDRFSFLIAENDFSKIASTGQSRLITLAMRNAQAHFYFKKTGRRPVLLIDDVLLELDRYKRERFIDMLPEYEQAFFTYLPGENIDVRDGNSVSFRVIDGRLEKI
ncbi:MAG: DNA replication and repair protein RecF [Spirochaetia bacterium]|nr:DNA replication and repair protein RecF [Spirochaetia bacterium]